MLGPGMPSPRFHVSSGTEAKKILGRVSERELLEDLRSLEGLDDVQDLDRRSDQPIPKSARVAAEERLGLGNNCKYLNRVHDRVPPVYRLPRARLQMRDRATGTPAH